MHSSQYVTNQFDTWIPVCGWLTNLRRIFATKFFNSSTWLRSWSSLVTKPYSVQIQQLLQEKDELEHMFSIQNMLMKKFCIEVHHLWQPLKQSLYMFRVVRKESPNIYSWIGVKSDLKNWFSLTSTDVLSIKQLSSIEFKQPFKPW